MASADVYRHPSDWSSDLNMDSPASTSTTFSALSTSTEATSAHSPSASVHHRPSHRRRNSMKELKDPIKAIKHALRRVPSYRELPFTQQRAASKQIYAVALGVLSGHWITELAMNEALVHEFAKALGTLAIMSNVCLFWEPRAGRAYVIHEPLLLQRLNRVLQPSPESHDTVFVVWDVDKDYSVTPAGLTYDAFDAAPWILPNLLSTKRMLEQHGPPPEECLSVMNLEQTWELESQFQGLFTLVSLHQFLVNYPTIYAMHVQDDVPPEPSGSLRTLESVKECKAWTATLHLEGVEPEDDLVLCRFCFPYDLFSFDKMDDSIKALRATSPHLNVREMLDSLQAEVDQRLETTYARTIWSNAAINTEGPWTHGKAWERCDLGYSVWKGMYTMFQSFSQPARQ